jgi:hypothetical protein
MRRRLLLAAASLVLAAVLLLVAPAAAGASARPGTTGATPAPTRPALGAAAPDQEPDAPADDGTGGSAEDDDGSGADEPVPGGDIIPEPNSGREPTEAGDRGGALQVLVLGVIVAGVGGITALAVRESRRKRAPRALP